MARYAIIENGVVANIAEAETPLAENWRDATGAQIGDTFDGRNYSRPAPDLADAKLALWAKAKTKRDAVIDGGAAVPGVGIFDSDMLSRINITGAVTMAQIALAQSQPFSITWTLADNSVVQLDASQMIGVGAAVGQFVAAAHVNAQVLRAAIEDAENLAELRAVDIEAGWP